WRNFISRYPEVNALHKKMLRVSDKVAAAGSPPGALTDLQRGQSNDVYWHGVFGGIYLPHLRQAAWRSLLAAEAAVGPADGRTRSEVLDYDFDGRSWTSSATSAAAVSSSPVRGPWNAARPSAWAVRRSRCAWARPFGSRKGRPPSGST